MSSFETWTIILLLRISKEDTCNSEAEPLIIYIKFDLVVETDKDSVLGEGDVYERIYLFQSVDSALYSASNPHACFSSF